MNVSDNIRKRVKAKSQLELFSLDSIAKESESHLAISKVLGRMCANGDIKRLRNGIYYKPKQSRFGEIKPAERNILRFLLFEKGKQVGYVSGERLYNTLGLTSQVPSVITIATNQSKRSGKFAGLNIRYVKANGQVSKDDIHLLRILDAVKDVDKVLDNSLTDSLNTLYQIIKELAHHEKKELVRIAQNYPPRVKALVGGMMNNIWNNKYKKALEPLHASIVNTSKFEYPINQNIIQNPKHWNIYETA